MSFIFILCSITMMVALDYDGWSEMTSPVLPRSSYQHSVGYNSLDDTIWILGGPPYQQQLISFKYNEGFSFTDHGSTNLSRQVWANECLHYYVQIGSILYIRERPASFFNTFDLNTLIFTANYTLPPLIYNVDACTTAIREEYITILGTDRVVQIFDLQQQIWLNSVPLLQIIRSKASCIYINDKIFIVGGFDFGVYLSSIEYLNVSPAAMTDIASVSWTDNVNSLPEARDLTYCIAHNDDILVIGGYAGQGSQNMKDTVYIINSITGIVSFGGNMAKAVQAPGIIFVDNIIFAFGGYSGGFLDEWQMIAVPTPDPTSAPSVAPSGSPSHHPTSAPSGSPSQPPSLAPSGSPSQPPTLTPSSSPSQPPTSTPSFSPTPASSAPSGSPSQPPSLVPSDSPSQSPTSAPSTAPSNHPSMAPSMNPTEAPTNDPTNDPTIDPTTDPTTDPTADPTADPTTDPTADPTIDPTTDPTNDPTDDPTTDPTADPTIDPTIDPTNSPSFSPSNYPTSNPLIITQEEIFAELVLDGDFDSLVTYLNESNITVPTFALNVIENLMNIPAAQNIVVYILNVFSGSIIIKYSLSSSNIDALNNAITNIDKSVGTAIVYEDFIFSVLSNKQITEKEANSDPDTNNNDNDNTHGIYKAVIILSIIDVIIFVAILSFIFNSVGDQDKIETKFNCRSLDGLILFIELFDQFLCWIFSIYVVLIPSYLGSILMCLLIIAEIILLIKYLRLFKWEKIKLKVDKIDIGLIGLLLITLHNMPTIIILLDIGSNFGYNAITILCFTISIISVLSKMFAFFAAKFCNKVNKDNKDNHEEIEETNAKMIELNVTQKQAVNETDEAQQFVD